MILDLGPDLRIERRTIGAEGAPLVIVDQFVRDPDRLVRKAARSQFERQGSYFPGLRARAPASYEALLGQLVRPMLAEIFGLPVDGRFVFPLCHYSLVTTSPAQLGFLQRIPHIDSHAPNGIATVHYLFRGDWGGTAFYRHRSTSYECVDADRREPYFRQLEEESHGNQAPAPGYIGEDTPLFERIGQVDGVFNRLVVYRRNSLHSATIDNLQVPPADPLTGRLSINTFIDVLS